MGSNQADKLKNLLSAKTTDLCSLKDIGTSRSWDYSLPTIGAHRGFTDRHNFASDSSFFDILKKDVNHGFPYEILENAGAFRKDNPIVLFGGSILDIIFKRHDDIRDFDLRLVGEEYVNDEAKCIAKAKEFVAGIFSVVLKMNEQIDERKKRAQEEGRSCYEGKCDLQEITVTRCRSTVTVHIPTFGDKIECIFQLTFAPTKSVEEMLSKCQPHCTRLAIKDGAVVLDQMARFCIESTCTVLDTSSFVNFYREDEEKGTEEERGAESGRTITSQISRLIKYYEEKGFDIILPELDMKKAPRRNLEFGVVEVLALPSMIVVYDEIRDNTIMTTKLSLPKQLKVSGTNVPIGEYDSSPTENVGECIHFNIRCLVHDVYDSFKFVAKGERYDHIFDFVPVLTPRMLAKSYETVTEYLQQSDIPIRKLTGYFSVTSPDQVLDKLIAEPMRNACQSGKLPKSFDLDEKLLKELTHKEIESLLVKINGLREKLKEKGLDKLVISFPENVSTVDELYDIFYGSNGLKDKREDE